MIHSPSIMLPCFHRKCNGLLKVNRAVQLWRMEILLLSLAARVCVQSSELAICFIEYHRQNALISHECIPVEKVRTTLIRRKYN
jgi:hypothetical protein